MISLIIGIIAIALVALLAFATLWFGGDELDNRRTEVDKATYINQAQQIVGAIYFYRAETGIMPDNLEVLEPDYIKPLPTPPEGEWELRPDGLYAPSAYEAVCDAVNVSSDFEEMQGVDEGRECSTMQSFTGKNKRAYFCCIDDVQTGG